MGLLNHWEKDTFLPTERLYLIDGSGYIFRAFYGIPMMTRSDGLPVNAVYGFCTMLGSLLERIGCNPVAVVFDKGRRTFRNDIYADYKMHRAEAPDELIPQFPIFREATKAFNVEMLELEGFEADDIIATYVKKARDAKMAVTIVSSDKDLMQLVGDEVEILDPMKNKTIRHAEVMEKFGVAPHLVVDVQALAGDTSDNIPGIKGIGPKIAAELIQEYGDLETLLENAHKIPQAKRRERVTEGGEMARISKKLVTLCPDVPLSVPLKDLCHKPFAKEDLGSFLDLYEFRKLKTRYLGEALAVKKEASGVYKTVINLQELQEIVAIIKERGVFSFDILWAPEKDKNKDSINLFQERNWIAGLALSYQEGESFFVPCHALWQECGVLKDMIKEQDVLSLLLPLLYDRSIHKIAYDVKNILYALLREGRKMACYMDDILLMHFALVGSSERHNLEILAQSYLGMSIPLLSDIVGNGKKAIPLTDASVFDDIVIMMQKRVDALGSLYPLLRKDLSRYHTTQVYDGLDKPLTDVLSKMQNRGILVDQEALRRLGDEFSARMATLQENIYQVTGETFNIASPKQLGEILFAKMGLPGGKKTKTGMYSTDAEVLETLASEHKVVRDVLDYRMYGKLLSTYVYGLLESVDDKTGRIHTRYDAVTAGTGRLSSLDPNLQNIPIKTPEGRRVRETFIASQGHVLVSMDYSQIELRILADMAGVPLLKEALLKGEDIHALTASQVFGVPLSEVTPLLRGRAKAVNFGIIYGISAFGLAAQLGVSRGEAKTFMDRYFERFPEILTFMETSKEFCRKNGYVETAFKRRIYLPGIHDKNFSVRGYAERQAINAPIQGTAADIMKRAMIRLDHMLEEKFPDVFLLLQVHDELILEVPESIVEAFSKEASPILEGAALPFYPIGVPLVVNVGSALNWSDAH